MATAQLSKSRPGRGPDEFVRRQIARAGWQIRGQELTRTGLLVAALVLAYAVAMALVDRVFILPPWARQLALAAFVVVTASIAAVALWRPLRQAVNPYFAARQIERAVPDAKNSLVNWLDLKDKELPDSVRGVIDARAAQDLRRVDVDAVTRDRGIVIGGLVVTALAVALVVLLCLFRPAQFFSLLARTFAPFAPTEIATRTQIDLLQPPEGDVTVAVNQSVGFRVWVGGKVPNADSADAVRIRWRYHPDDTVWEERPLENLDGGAEWSVRITAAQVRNGFQYQIVGGDAATPVHTVTVRSMPLFTDFEAHYKFRPYLRYADEVRRDPNLRAVRGTEVRLVARTNRPARDGWLKFTDAADGSVKSVAAEKIADDPAALVFALTLEREGKYRLRFTDRAGEESDETLPFNVEVLADQPPQVEITRPGPDSLPINGTLSVGGRAVDDFGLKEARLAMRLKPDPNKDEMIELAPKPHPIRPAEDGTAPRLLEYQDFVGFESLAKPHGAQVEPRPGMILEYWLEAEDICDFPRPQVGRSAVYRLKFTDPVTPEQQQQQRREAEQKKRENQQQPDGTKPGTDGTRDGSPDKSQNGEAKPGEAKPDEAGEGQPRNGEPKSGDRREDSKPGEGESEDERRLEEMARKIQEELKKREQQERAAKNPNDGQSREGERQPQANQPPSREGERSPQEGEKPPREGERSPQEGEKPSREGERQPQANQPPPREGERQPDTEKPPGRDPNPGAGTDEPAAPKPSDAQKPGQPDEGDGRDTAKSPKPDARPNGDRAPEVEKQVRDHQQGDADQQKQAEKALDEMKDNAADPKTRRDAAEALDELREQKAKPDGAKSPDDPRGQPTRPADSSSPDARKQPEVKPGDGSPPKPGDRTEKAPSDAKPTSNAPSEQLPPDLQKMVDEFQKAEPKRRSEIQDELRDMAKKPQSSDRKKQLDQAMKECNCDQDGSSGKSDKPKAGGDGQGTDNTSPSETPMPKPSEGEGQGQEKPGQQPGGSQPRPGASENTDGQEPGRSPDAGRPGEGEKPGQQPPTSPGESKGGDGKSDPKAGPQRQPAKPDTAAEPNNTEGPGRKGGSNPTGGAEDGGDTVGSGTGTGEEAGGTAPNEEFLSKTGELQLESFRKKVDRQMLRDLNMTEEEYRQFLRSYEELLKKRSATPADADRVRGAATGKTSANTKTRRVEPTQAGPESGDRFGASKAPPEFREQYKDFTAEPKK